MILFLSETIVRAAYKTLIDLYGGVHGVRDTNILDAALNLPKAQFGGEFLHPSIFHMAAAYGFTSARGNLFLMQLTNRWYGNADIPRNKWI